MAAIGLATGDAMGAGGDATGLTALIDVESGRLGRARRASDGAWFERHPGSGAAIEGRTVPGWPEGVRVACRAAEATPFTRVMAWELTLTDRGPVISDARDDGLAMFQILPDRGLLASPLGSLLLASAPRAIGCIAIATAALRHSDRTPAAILTRPRPASGRARARNHLMTAVQLQVGVLQRPARLTCHV